MEMEMSMMQSAEVTDMPDTDTETSEGQEQPLTEEEFVLHEEEILDTDPLKNLSDTESAAVYALLPKGQQKLYRELVSHHHTQMKLHDVMVPTYKQVRSIIFQNFPNIP